MTIRIALHHSTQYSYDRPISLGPQLIRLRPAFHARTPIEAYSLRVEPAEHFCNWQQDPFGNPVARYVFPKQCQSLSVTVDLVADSGSAGVSASKATGVGGIAAANDRHFLVSVKKAIAGGASTYAAAHKRLF